MSGETLRTGHFEEPERRAGRVRERDELDVTGEQGAVRAAECHDAAGLFLGRVHVVDMALEPEGDLGRVELVVVEQGLPERGGARRCEVLEGETEDAGDVAVEQAVGHLLHDEESLGVDGEARHLDGVLGEEADDVPAAVTDADSLRLAGRTGHELDGGRLARVEGGRLAAGETLVAGDPKVGGAGVKDDLERLRRVADRDDTEVGRIGVLGTVFGCREEDEGLEDAPG